jgi:hypothetical protein
VPNNWFNSGLFRLLNLDTLILTTDFNVWYGAHGGCDRSARDAYSSMTPDSTSDIFRGPCTPILWFVFPVGRMWLITVRYFCHSLNVKLIRYQFWCTICAFRLMKSRQWYLVKKVGNPRKKNVIKVKEPKETDRYHLLKRKVIPAN